MPGLASLPRWATIAASGAAGVGLAARGAWPTREELFILLTTIACLYGTLRLPSQRQRMLCAILWLGILIALAIWTPRRNVGMDFQTFYDGAAMLFGQHQSPYTAPWTTAFPFPTFLFIWALSFLGHFSAYRTLGLLIGLEIGLLGTGVVLMRRVIRAEMAGAGPDLAKSLVQIGLALHPAVLAGIALGQSSAMAGITAIWAVWCWRCGKGRWSWHAAAILLNLAWMFKPQLLIAAGFFLANGILEARHTSDVRSRAASIGRLIVPWAVVLVSASLLLAFPGHVFAYRDFPQVVMTWHTLIAATHANNYAFSAVLAKSLERMWGIPVLQSLPILAAVIASLVVCWNTLSLIAARPDSLRAFLPWLLASLLWTSLVWEHYLSLVLAGLTLLVVLRDTASVTWMRPAALRISVGVGLTMVLSSFAFVLGVLLLYFHSHAMLAQESAACQSTGGGEAQWP